MKRNGIEKKKRTRKEQNKQTEKEQKNRKEKKRKKHFDADCKPRPGQPPKRDSRLWL